MTEIRDTIITRFSLSEDATDEQMPLLDSQIMMIGKASDFD